MKTWLSLIITLPTENATSRQRAWRSLKASGAAVLRDGVYLMPERDECRASLNGLAADVRAAGGIAHLLRVEATDETDFVARFDRSHEFARLLSEITQTRQRLIAAPGPELPRQLRKLRKSYATLAEIDFFPGEAQRQADNALRELEWHCVHLLSPDEPQIIDGEIPRRQVADYQGRIWATRRRPWVDRLACAWLIQRFIDPKAQLLWLATPADCPADALGFDFDGATFSHVGSRVSFEVLLASFGLEQPALIRLGLLIHYLDVGGIQPPEAAGIEKVLTGMRDCLTDDDLLLKTATCVFDGLLASFDTGTPDS